jgi:PAS domain S-box-containing protein
VPHYPARSLSDDLTPLHALLENTPDAVYFKDLESRFVHFSRSFREIFHISDPEVIRGKTDSDFFSAEHATSALADEQEIIRSGRPIVGKLEKETFSDGRVTWALTTKMPWRDAQGNIIGTFGISKNVTPLKEAEGRVAHEQQLLRTLLENIPDRIYFKDSQSCFVHVSKSFRDFHHATNEDVLGRSDADLFAPEHAVLALKDEQEIIRTGEAIIGKLEKETHPDGRVTWAMTSKMPWRDTRGLVIGTFGISRDVTAVKEAEAELETAHKRLLEASRFAGMAEVTSNVLHNVGNALNSINVSCTLAIQSLKEWNLDKLAKIPPLLAEHAGQLDEFLTTDPRGRHIPDYLGLIARTFEEQKTSWLSELDQLRKHVEHVNQIVAMQQSYAKVMGVVETVAPAQLVEDAIQINAAAIDRHKINLVRDFEPAPSILVDKHKVLQILINLLRNAKYAVTDKADGDEKRVTVRVFPLGDEQIRILVVDNGVGIPPENLTRIFVHGFTTRKEGHGFGLHSGALAAREMGGELSAQSDGIGRGATFSLTLPVKGPAQA